MGMEMGIGDRYWGWGHGDGDGDGGMEALGITLSPNCRAVGTNLDNAFNGILIEELEFTTGEENFENPDDTGNENEKFNGHK